MKKGQKVNDAETMLKKSKIEVARRNEKEVIFYSVDGRMGFCPDSIYGNGGLFVGADVGN